MNKKLITIIVVVLCIIALGTGVYFAWQKTRTILTPPSSSPQGFTNGQSVSINDGSTGSVPGGATTSKLSVISDKTVYGYWVFNSNSTSTQSGVFYIGRDGIIYKVKD